MLQDFDNGRPLKLSAITDAALELARAAGIAMPVTRLMASMARFAEQSAFLKRSTHE